MSRKPSSSASSPPAFRPPDFLLPQFKGTPAHSSVSGPKIFLSWDGEIHGPTSTEEVIAGIRAASFADNVFYWFEGQREWQPLAEFSEAASKITASQSAPSTAFSSNVPTLAAPTEASHETLRRRRRKRSSHRPSATSKSPTKKSNTILRGFGIILIFALLAIGVTVGIILLLHTLIR